MTPSQKRAAAKNRYAPPAFDGDAALAARRAKYVATGRLEDKPQVDCTDEDIAAIITNRKKA